MFTSISCYTLFDITDTGIRSHIRSAKFPMTDKHGNQIKNESDWICARNQQRNWETILQVLSLRTQPLRIIGPRKVCTTGFSERGGVYAYAWKFTFESEHEQVFGDDNNRFRNLKNDCDGVPMLTGLGESMKLTPYLITQNRFINTYFEINN